MVGAGGCNWSICKVCAGGRAIVGPACVLTCQSVTRRELLSDGAVGLVLVDLRFARTKGPPPNGQIPCLCTGAETCVHGALSK